MQKFTIALITGLVLVFGGHANACQMNAAPAEAAGAPGAVAQQDVFAQRMALMQERDALLLEMAQLLKDTAKDKETKAKAESLEKRIQVNIEKHNKIHAMMMGGVDGMAHKKDGGCADKAKPCPMKSGAPADKKAN